MKRDLHLLLHFWRCFFTICIMIVLLLCSLNDLGSESEGQEICDQWCCECYKCWFECSAMFEFYVEWKKASNHMHVMHYSLMISHLHNACIKIGPSQFLSKIMFPLFSHNLLKSIRYPGPSWHSTLQEILQNSVFSCKKSASSNDVWLHKKST